MLARSNSGCSMPVTATGTKLCLTDTATNKRLPQFGTPAHLSECLLGGLWWSICGKPEIAIFVRIAPDADRNRQGRVALGAGRSTSRHTFSLRDMTAGLTRFRHPSRYISVELRLTRSTGTVRPTTPANSAPVTADNLMRAELGAVFAGLVAQGGFGKFYHNRNLTPTTHSQWRNAVRCAASRRRPACRTTPRARCARHSWWSALDPGRQDPVAARCAASASAVIPW